MAGKTTIDTDLRNELIEFLGNLKTENLELASEVEQAKSLYGRLLPQRKRTRKVVEEPAATPVQSS